MRIEDGISMIVLVINLSGKAEERFNELLKKSGAIGKDDIKELIMDALALLYTAATETASGKKLAIFDPQTKEATLFTVPSLEGKG